MNGPEVYLALMDHSLHPPGGANREGGTLAIQEKASSLAIGSRFGRYEIVSHHGSGGMADIWVARLIEPRLPEAAPDSSNGRFAIKTLLKRRLHHAEYVDRFDQEAELHRHLDHPNIVRFLESDVEGAVRYMVLEFVEGMNLRQMLHAARPRPLPRGVVYDVMAGICDALHYLHELGSEDGPLGLVHCDVSPENVLIGLDGKVKLIDFGVTTSTLAPGSAGPSSAVLESSVLRPGRHVPPGRLQYLAPERIEGRGLDRRSDIYSMGAMLFELVYGVRPFEADTVYDLLTKICQGATVGVDPAVDAETRDLIERAMAVSPDDRIDTAHHLAEALRLLRELVDPDEQTAGAFVRRLFGLEEPEEAEEIDLLWTEERVTAEVACLDSPSDTPLLEEGTALDVRVRELLQQSSRAAMPSDSGMADRSRAASVAHPLDRAWRASDALLDGSERASPSSIPPSLFAPVARPRAPSLDLFDTYGKRPRAPASGTFLAAREDSWVPEAQPKPKPARAAAAHFETGWHLLREGRTEQTLVEWEAALRLDPNNRSYAVNVQKLRTKLQR